MPEPVLPLPVEEPRKRVSAAAAVEALARPSLLFSGVLFALLLLSWFLLLPRFARVEVEGRLWTVQELTAHKAELTAQILQMEEEREDEALSVRDDAYKALKTARTSRVPMARIVEETHARATMAADGDATIRIDALQYDPVSGTVALRGDVHGAGARSMTVLASFVEALEESALVASVETPRFVREEDPRIGPHSPFAFTLTLRP